MSAEKINLAKFSTFSPSAIDSSCIVEVPVTTGEFADRVPLKPFEADEDEAAGGAIIEIFWMEMIAFQDEKRATRQ